MLIEGELARRLVELLERSVEPMWKGGVDTLDRFADGATAGRGASATSLRGSRTRWLVVSRRPAAPSCHCANGQRPRCGGRRYPNRSRGNRPPDSNPRPRRRSFPTGARSARSGPTMIKRRSAVVPGRLIELHVAVIKGRHGVATLDYFFERPMRRFPGLRPASVARLSTCLAHWASTMSADEWPDEAAPCGCRGNSSRGRPGPVVSWLSART